MSGNQKKQVPAKTIESPLFSSNSKMIKINGRPEPTNLTVSNNSRDLILVSNNLAQIAKTRIAMDSSMLFPYFLAASKAVAVADKASIRSV
jgi:hypothetical protein